MQTWCTLISKIFILKRSGFYIRAVKTAQCLSIRYFYHCVLQSPIHRVSRVILPLRTACHLYKENVFCLVKLFLYWPLFIQMYHNPYSFTRFVHLLYIILPWHLFHISKPRLLWQTLQLCYPPPSVLFYNCLIFWVLQFIETIKI